MRSEILIVGDVHGDFGTLNQLMNKKKPKIVLQCGDFGYWPRFRDFRLKAPLPPEGCKLYWCDGNHEDFEVLYRRETDELWPGVIYKPRGSVLTLPDGRNILFMGGAQSIDKESRTNRISWFEEEEICQRDINNLPDVHIDIVISHTCPVEFDKVDKWVSLNKQFLPEYNTKVGDWSRKALSFVLEKYRPQKWYYGHWHTHLTDVYEGCEWMCLDMARGMKKWWDWLGE